MISFFVKLKAISLSPFIRLYLSFSEEALPGATNVVLTVIRLRWKGGVDSVGLDPIESLWREKSSPPIEISNLVSWKKRKDGHFLSGIAEQLVN